MESPTSQVMWVQACVARSLPAPKLRIVALSDGKDTCSDKGPLEVARRLPDLSAGKEVNTESRPTCGESWKILFYFSKMSMFYLSICMKKVCPWTIFWSVWEQQHATIIYIYLLNNSILQCILLHIVTISPNRMTISRCWRYYISI